MFLAYKHFGYTITLTTFYYSNIVCKTILVIVNDLFNRPLISVIGYLISVSLKGFSSTAL